MMLINSDGQYYGMLSGGCLESDIVRNARKVMADSKSRVLVYDSTDEDDWSHQLGIGCGGRIELLLQLVQDRSSLANMIAALESQEAGFFAQNLNSNQFEFSLDSTARNQHPRIISRDGQDWLLSPVVPEPHLLIIGGGRDAQPVAQLAQLLGWTVSVTDPRPANARPESFPGGVSVLNTIGEELTQYMVSTRVDAVVGMSHNLTIDAKGLLSCLNTPIKYLALLGPEHRYHEVMGLAGLTAEKLPCQISAPAGADIGGHLPESIALSIITECHAILHKAQPQLQPFLRATSLCKPASSLSSRRELADIRPS